MAKTDEVLLLQALVDSLREQVEAQSELLLQLQSQVLHLKKIVLHQGWTR